MIVPVARQSNDKQKQEPTKVKDKHFFMLLLPVRIIRIKYLEYEYDYSKQKFFCAVKFSGNKDAEFLKSRMIITEFEKQFLPYVKQAMLTALSL